MRTRVKLVTLKLIFQMCFVIILHELLMFCICKMLRQPFCGDVVAVLPAVCMCVCDQQVCDQGQPYGREKRDGRPRPVLRRTLACHVSGKRSEKENSLF
jgi:hypothetical protein